MVSWIFEEYDDNLDEQKLAKIPTARLQTTIDSCDRSGDGRLCEVCRVYADIIKSRKK